EYATGTITATCPTWTPDSASLGVSSMQPAGRGLLPGSGFTAANGYPPLSPLDGSTARAASGTVLYLVLVALLSLGAGTALREPAAAITAVLALLWIVPVITRLAGDATWQDRLEKVSPMPAGLAVQATRNLDRLPIGPWQGLGVLAAYAAAALLAGGVLLAVRDA
ncbi:ABC transporter permease, partial [Actinomadura sp. BRA 177]|uniref:ABC transporter permease n=1 Tax=Actinomadura sp. BRA 177 TaxID=2745202 RepID=UPI0018398B28